AYGSGQTVNQSGTVTASGQGGTGIRFDFGSSSNGADDEYRGSYIRYKRNVKTDGTMTATGEGLGNLPLRIESAAVYNAAPDELNGAMVENYNLSGALVGGENAIYIGKNAFVKNININNGASIRGNITSDWKRFGAEDCEGSYDVDNPLKIQYNGGSYAYDAYIPDLVTNLNFNADMTYNGNITGEDNMKLFVNGGTLNYGGTANVVSVQVAKGATLFGGKYVLNRLTPADGFSDDTTGTFINHGMMAPASGGDLTIAGKLLSDGDFGLVTQSDGQAARKIAVTGDATVTGTKLVNIEEQAYLPGQEYTYLQAASITGSMGSVTGDYFSGFLNIDNINNNNVTLSRANNLGALDGNQAAVYNSLDGIYDRTDAAGRARLGRLYSLGVETGKAALTDMSTGAATDASLVLRQSSVMNALTARHRYLTHQANVPVTIPMESLVKHFAPTSPEASASSVDPGLDLIVPVELSEGGGFWFKFAKGWGSYGKGDVTGNGFTTTVGADYPVSPQWKLGALFSYSNESYGGKRDHRDTKDSRFGVYGDWRLGPQSAFLYLGGGWQKHDQKRHFYAGDHYNANGDYSSNTIEFDGRYTYDLDYGKQGWHNKPFVSLQAIHYRQGGYSETGAYEFGQAVDSASNTYTAASVGWDFARDFGKDGYLEFELGLMQTLGGDHPSYSARLVGGGEKFTIRSRSMDKTRVLAGIYGSQAISDRWRIGGEVALAQGAHDQDVSVSLSLRFSW
ncbi:MAG: autotransporter outer membrane beta-barrel domain-containing protein, partial [Schwartzia sp.]|nr:autotransporter outer membrane beta-barrel domain-containing protein [Schwartzia sp. (in: firmicutes)]